MKSVYISASTIKWEGISHQWGFINHNEAQGRGLNGSNSGKEMDSISERLKVIQCIFQISPRVGRLDRNECML